VVSDHNRINAQELDRHITGNYGEDGVAAGEYVDEIIDRLGLRKPSRDVTEQIVKAVVAGNVSIFGEMVIGKEKALHALVGKVMAVNGNVDPALVKTILLELSGDAK
jgi:Asp-tRNA(Asn)/Glu-tRNA(Gln) amidotransferase B subunit